jgi:D-arabinose 1-dehydrogenase-like Zn-dependent alcohol dehydrogenase
MACPVPDMRAAVLWEFGASPTITRVPRPRPAPGEALVRVRAVGLCGTDLKIASGAMRPDLALPSVLGHEIAGEVVSAPGAALPVGTRVACHPYLACGKCHACTAGHGNVCLNVELVGLDRQGGLADYLAVPVDNLIPFAAGTDFGAAAVSMDAVATTWHALYERGRIAAGERVIVVGAGGLGLNAVQVAVGAGATVAVVDRSPTHLEAAASSGAACAVSFDDVARLQDWSRTGADLALEATGSRHGFDTAASALGIGGRLVCCGHTPGVEFGLESFGLVGRELSVLGSRGSTLTDATAALAAVERGDIRPRIDSVHDLDRIDEAFTLLASHQALGRIVVTV